MLKNYLLLFAFFSISLLSYSTHNRAGEITYKHISGFTYEITITTCTNTAVEADREWILINFGDSPFCTYNDSIQRVSEVTVLDYPDSKINTYIGFHTYSGMGSFKLSVLDYNRNEGVLNLPGSVTIPFYIETELIITPLTGNNNSAQLLNPPKANCCLNQLWFHNPAAYDPDGDLLKYSLIPSRGTECTDIPVFSYPDEYTDDPTDTFTIDENTGTVLWDSPSDVGQFNFAILIEEFREVDGNLIKVGSVVRDMQIDVLLCDNEPPAIEPIADVCVRINDLLQFNVNASDPDGDSFVISAVGGPMTEVENTAQFNNSSNVFTWVPECPEVMALAYQMNFFVQDDPDFGQPPLQSVETVNIQVIPTRVENPNVQANGLEMLLTWEVHECIFDVDPSDYSDFTYKIYRRSGPYNFTPDYCETGVPNYTGYSFIGQVEGLDNNAYVDSENLSYGGEYCYMIVTCWPDGSESIASEEICAEIIKDIPVMTNVSVAFTGPSTGIVNVAWSPANDLDTSIFPGPYQYKLYWAEGYSNADNLIYQSSTSSDLLWADTLFTHNGLNTESVSHVYRVELFSGGGLVASSSNASSIFLTLEPNDNQLEITMNHQVPWFNQIFEIYRFDGANFVLIDTSNEAFYIDDGLVNSQTYCYYVKSIGTYDAEFVIDPIENLSQEVCGFPVDLTPPCPPELTGNANCEDELAELSWTNPDWTCSDDTQLFTLYYTPTIDGEYEAIETFILNGTYTFDFNEENSIAGCFYITAEDSLQPGIDGFLTNNVSDPSNIVCIDNCPEYILPNIFTPNGDDHNDTFHPFLPYKFIDSVDVKIFNRWGNLVFETTDPLINWDGVNMESGTLSASGTYYYVGTIYTRRLTGIMTEEVSGYFQMMDARDPVTE